MRPRISFALAGLLIVALAVACFADTQERVAPPEDAARLHLSVVGIVNNAQYQSVLSWFQKDEKLASLRRTVHFHQINAGSAMYEERYAPNIKGLPTVRLQDGEGRVLYESWGSNLPKSPVALASAIETKTEQLFDPPLLPWRRQMQQKCGPQGCPSPQQELTPEDLMENDFGAPPVDVPIIEPEPEGVPAWLCVLLAVVSAGGGFIGAILGSARREMQG